MLKKVDARPPWYFFKAWDYEKEARWNTGFSLDKLMSVKSNGIVTGADKKLIAESRDALRAQVLAAYGEFEDTYVQRLNYRLFETTFIYNDPSKIERSRKAVMGHYAAGQPQIGLLISKQVRDVSFAHVFVTKLPSEAIFLSGDNGNECHERPLYLYPEGDEDDQRRRINFDQGIYGRLQNIGSNDEHGQPDELAVFDYIYGVLHCPAYRETYAEFLKIDFPIFRGQGRPMNSGTSQRQVKPCARCT